MNVKEFTKETLKQIVEAIHELNSQEDGLSIPLGGIIGEGVHVLAAKNGKTQNLIKVEFDIAVTVSESTEKSGSGNANLYVLKLDGDYSKSNQNQNVSRVKFMLPLKIKESNQ